jgi:hypothetical protein
MIPLTARVHAFESPAQGTFSVGSLGPVAVLIWHTEVTLEGARAIGDVFATLKARALAGGFGFLTVLDGATDIRPTAAARRAMAEVLQLYGNDIGAAAIAYEGDGFKATIVRSVITAINIAGSARFPNRVFSETSAAIDWLSGKLGGDLSQAMLRSGVNRLRDAQKPVGGRTLAIGR